MVLFFCVYSQRAGRIENLMINQFTALQMKLICYKFFLWEIIGGLITEQNETRQKFQRRIAIICNNEESTEAVEDNVLFSSFQKIYNTINFKD